MGVLEATLKAIEASAARHESALVSLSGGKDSLVCLDLAVRSFKRVEAFTMWVVPEGRVIHELIAKALEPYQGRVKHHWYPHWLLAGCLREGIFCQHRRTPDFRLRDIYNAARRETGCTVILMGAKKTDSMSRRRRWDQSAYPDVLRPLGDWTKWDVLSYLKAHKLRVCLEETNLSETGLTVSSLLTLHDGAPDDFERLKKIFPFAEAVVARRKFYGLGPTNTKVPA